MQQPGYPPPPYPTPGFTAQAPVFQPGPVRPMIPLSFQPPSFFQKYKTPILICAIIVLALIFGLCFWLFYSSSTTAVPSASGATGPVCTNPPCSVNGICSSGPSGPYCACSTGYSGADCSVGPSGPTGPVCSPACTSNGSCVSGASGPYCSCNTGYSGIDCSVGPSGATGPGTSSAGGATSTVCTPTVSKPGDGGYGNMFQGWGNVSNKPGTCNDYCRFVGDPPNVFLACAIGGNTASNQYSYRTPVGMGVDAGYPGTGYLKDENGDGYDDFCRCVGTGTNTFVACIKGTPTGFDSNNYGINLSATKPKNCIGMSGATLKNA